MGHDICTRTNPMETQGRYKGTLVWGQDIYTQNQFMGTRCMHTIGAKPMGPQCSDFNEPILCGGNVYGDMVCVQRTWTCASIKAQYKYKGPILCGHVQRTNGMGDTACTYTYLCTVSSEGSMSCMKNQLYGNSTCTERSCQKECF